MIFKKYFFVEGTRETLRILEEYSIWGMESSKLINLLM
jgi:hypothetical protein